jgi:hypothetical protein
MSTTNVAELRSLNELVRNVAVVAGTDGRVMISNGQSNSFSSAAYKALSIRRTGGKQLPHLGDLGVD